MSSSTDIIELFDEWNQALQTKDPDKVVSLYADDAVLLPTLSNEVRHNHHEIKDYFIHFLAKNPQGSIDESNIRIFDDLAVNSGIYSFKFGDGTIAKARFTFVYLFKDQIWKIIEHHSSLLPE